MGLYPKYVLDYLALAGIPRGPNSKLFVVDPGHGSDTNSGDHWNAPLATISAALALCTTGHHDTVLVVGSATAITETAAVDWNLNLTHLVGLGTRGLYGKRTRIISGTDDLSPFITVSGYGCIFKNLRIVHEQADDTGSLVCVKVTGARNLFEDVEFCGNVTASSAIDTGCSLQIGSGGSENLFRRCVFGMDTVESATGLMAIVVNASAGAARNRFEDCVIHGYAGSTSAGFVELMNATAIDRAMTFKRCEFINLGGSTMASAFVFTGGVDARYKRVFLIDCVGLGFTDWDAGDTGMLYTNQDVLTRGGVGGFLQASLVA